MRKLIFLIFILSIIGYACKQKAAPVSPEDPTEVDLPVTDLDSARVLLDGNYCYRYVTQRDTYDIRFTLAQGKVTGEMSFDNYEKDSSEGSINGYLKDDIIHVSYRFRSEGMSSVRSMYFRVRGDLLITGVGEEMTEGDSAYIKDPAAIRYEGLVYSKTQCE